jgi:hypothetical protein
VASDAPISPVSTDGVKDTDSILDDHDFEDEMSEARSPLRRQLTDGRSQQPLLKDEERGRLSSTFADDFEEGSPIRPNHSRRSTFRSRTPDYNTKNDTRKKYIYAGCFLLISLISFVVQTETAVYIQHELHWNKPYCML